MFASRHRWTCGRLLVGLLGLLLCFPGRALGESGSAASGRSVYWLTLDGPLLPVMTHYLESGIRTAEQAGAEAVVVALDSTGGTTNAVPQFVSVLLASQVPIILVIPADAELATSAPYLLLAADLVVAGDGWIGPLSEIDATPQIATSLLAPAQPGAVPIGQPSAARTASAQLLTDLGRARGHPELTAWLLQVLDNGTPHRFDPDSAGVVPLTIGSQAGALQAIHAQVIENSVRRVRLNTDGATIVALQPAWYLQVALILADPLSVVLLLLIGLVGLISEVLHPGGVFPGLAGIFCLAGAGWLFSQLPVAPVGLAMLIIGALLMLGEAKVGGPGFLGVPGTLAFLWGGWHLIPPAYAPLQVNRVGIMGGGVVILGLGMAAISYLQRTLRSRVSASADAGLVGELAEVREAIDPNGVVHVRGEYWSAIGPEGVVMPAGTEVRVIGRTGMLLQVEPVAANPTTMPAP